MWPLTTVGRKDLTILSDVKGKVRENERELQGLSPVSWVECYMYPTKGKGQFLG